MINMTTIEDAFKVAKARGCSYIAVKIKFTGGSTEYIIIPNADFDVKLAYYKMAYTDDLKLKANNQVSIVDVACGCSFTEIEVQLVGGKYERVFCNHH